MRVRNAAGAFLFSLFFGCLILSLLTARQNGTFIVSQEGLSILDRADVCAECHQGPPVNASGSVQFVGLPATYEPGRTYDLGITITPNPPAQGFGFQLVSVHVNNNQATQAGTLQRVTQNTDITPFRGVSHLSHTQPLNSGQVSFRWTAPAQGGPVTFRVASNSANLDNDRTGDRINTASATINPAPAQNEQVFYFPQIADALAGNLSFTTELLFDNTGAATNVRIEFFSSNGAPLPITLGNRGTNSTFNIPLARGESLSLETPGTQEGFRVGYAKITAGPGVGATAVFKRIEVRNAQRILLTEAGVPATGQLKDFSVVVDSLGNRDTGLALVNIGNAPANIRIRLYDENFALIDEVNLVVPPGEHRASFIFELFAQAGKAATAERAREMQGSATIASDQNLAAVTLRQNDRPVVEFPEEVPTLTTFPVIEGRADQ